MASALWILQKLLVLTSSGCFWLRLAWPRRAPITNILAHSPMKCQPNCWLSVQFQALMKNLDNLEAFIRSADFYNVGP